MSNSLTSQTVLITGPTCGIGFELAHLFAQHGFQLVLVGRDNDELRSLSESLTKHYQSVVHTYVSDLAESAAAQRVFDWTQSKALTVDMLVNNAGFGLNQPFQDTELSTLTNMMAVNIVALTQLTRLFLPGMISRRSGSILLLSSIAGFFPGPLMSVYYASKAYVLSFGVALATELKSSGVSVTTLCPGPTKSHFAATANTARSKSFSVRPLASAQSVAQQGFEAMMAKKTVKVIGLTNKLGVFFAKLLPLELTAKISKQLQLRPH